MYQTRADFEFFDPAKLPPELAAAVREHWPGRRPVWVAVSAAKAGRAILGAVAHHFGEVCEVDSEPLGGGLTLHAGLPRRPETPG